MYRHDRKIDRTYDKPFFNRKRSYGRLIFVLIMLTLIVLLPVTALSQADRIQFATLDALGYAPTATPYAGERAALGEEFYRRGNIEAAAALFELAAQQQPENISYLYEYGQLLIELDRNDEAEIIGEQMIELAPDDPRGYALKANSIAWTNPTEAIPAALEGRDIDESFAPIYSALAVSYTRIGRYTEALRMGDLAVRLNPSYANARRSLSYPLIYTGNYSEAIRQLEQAIAINPNIVGPYFELAALYRNPAINQSNVSIAIFNEILNIEPDNAQAYLRLCETYAAAGEFRLAEPYCDSALEIDPNYASAHRMRGQLRYSRRNYEGAIESFERCQALSINNPDDPDYDNVEIECIYVLGLAHYFLAVNDNCDRAWQWLNIALNHPEASGAVQENILQGLANTRTNCPGYRNEALPTPLPPTPIPPTPIGGF